MPAALASVPGRESPSIREMVSRRTTAWTIADSVNPKISDQVICQVIEPAIFSASRMPLRIPISATFLGGNGQQLVQAMFEQLVREAGSQAVVDDPAIPSRLDQSR